MASLFPSEVGCVIEACRQAREWQDAGLPFKRISVNVSAPEFRAETFLAGVRNTLRETGLKARYLDLELTESVLMRHADLSAVKLHALKKLGVHIAVDDFGTGLFQAQLSPAVSHRYPED